MTEATTYLIFSPLKITLSVNVTTPRPNGLLKHPLISVRTPSALTPTIPTWRDDVQLHGEVRVGKQEISCEI